MQHQKQRRGIELLVGNRKRLELAAPHFDRSKIPHAPTRGLQHLAGSVHGDYVRDKRRKRARDLPRAAAEVANRPPLIEKRRQRLQMGGRAK